MRRWVPKISGGNSKTPDQVAGLFGWFDNSTLVGADNSAVVAFADLSGSGNNLAGTATLRTGVNGQNGLNISTFDGVANQMLALGIGPLAQPYSMFHNFQILNNAAGPVAFKWATGCELQINNGGSFLDPQCGNGTDRSIAAADVATHTMGFVYSSPASFWRIDNGPWTAFATDPGAAALTSIVIASGGAAAFLNMKHFESAFYNVAVSTTGGDGDKLFNGFRTKWNTY